MLPDFDFDIDLEKVMENLKYLAIGVLTLTFVVGFVIPILRAVFTEAMSQQTDKPKVEPGAAPAPSPAVLPVISSDQKPPAGFVEHLGIIEEAAPNASADVWWKYAKSGMTKAEVALAEAKLARKTV